jgi:hypothetical protein
MPGLVAIAIAAGALTIGSTVTDAKHWVDHSPHNTAKVATFYDSRFDNKADCLTAAATAHVRLDACGSED